MPLWRRCSWHQAPLPAPCPQRVASTRPEEAARTPSCLPPGPRRPPLWLEGPGGQGGRKVIAAGSIWEFTGEPGSRFWTRGLALHPEGAGPAVISIGLASPRPGRLQEQGCAWGTFGSPWLHGSEQRWGVALPRPMWPSLADGLLEAGGPRCCTPLPAGELLGSRCCSLLSSWLPSRGGCALP